MLPALLLLLLSAAPASPGATYSMQDKHTVQESRRLETKLIAQCLIQPVRKIYNPLLHHAVRFSQFCEKEVCKSRPVLLQTPAGMRRTGTGTSIAVECLCCHRASSAEVHIKDYFGFLSTLFFTLLTLFLAVAVICQHNYTK